MRYSMKLFSACFTLLALPQYAHAGTEPLFAPQPDWVTSLPQKPAEVEPENAVRQFDRQMRVTPKGLDTYIKFVFKAASGASLAGLSNLAYAWDPEKGDLTIHQIEIVRDGKIINIMDKKPKLTVLRREQGLEKLQISGVLTATLQLEGVQIGDEIRSAFSVSQFDPALGGIIEGGQPIQLGKLDPVENRLRLIWPDNIPLKWKMTGGALQPVAKRRAGDWEILLTDPKIKTPETPNDAPARYKFPEALVFSTFSDWQHLSRHGAGLFSVEGLVAADPALLALSQEIAAKSADPKVRIAHALQIVQDRVRYLYNGLSFGSYMPAKVSDTWSRKYGDCKGKTLLLLALLRHLNFEAEAVLVNANFRGASNNVIPSMQAFDHVVVRVKLNGGWLWLDGTQLGDRIEDLSDVPAFEFGLPLRKEGASLEPIAVTAPFRPMEVTQLSIDASAGLSLPAPFKLTSVVRGQAAQGFKIGKEFMPKADFEALVERAINAVVSSAVITESQLSFSDTDGTATLVAKGTTTLSWTTDKGLRIYEPDTPLSDLSIYADRTSTALAHFPVSTGGPGHAKAVTQIRLPAQGRGFSLSYQTAVNATVAGHAISIEPQLNNDTFTLTTTDKIIANELLSDRLGDERIALAKVQANALEVRAPADYPTRNLEIREALAAGRVTPIKAIYAALKQKDAEDTSPFLTRADFFELINDDAAALKEMDAVIRIQPNAENLVRRGQMRLEREPLAAVTDAVAALTQEPGLYSALSLRAAARIKNKQYDMALGELDEAVAQGAEKSSVHELRSQVLDKAGRTADAIAEMDKAIALSPGKPELLNERCWLKGTRNIQLDTALKDCTKAIALMDDSNMPLDSRGLVYFRLNKLSEALEDFDAALKIAPEQAASLYMRGIVRTRMGEKDAGAKDIAQARKIADSVDSDFTEFGIQP